MIKKELERLKRKYIVIGREISGYRHITTLLKTYFGESKYKVCFFFCEQKLEIFSNG